MTRQVDLAMIALNLLAGAALLALLGVLAWVSWVVARARATTQHRVLRGTRGRLVPASCAALCVFAATAAYGEAVSASRELPHAWQVVTVDGEDRGYVMLALGAYLFIVQIVLGLAVLTREAARPAGGVPAGRARDSGSDIGAALLSTLLLAAALVAVAAMTGVGYVQLLATLA